ncbi:uncharacterized protein BJ171DRAFT_490637 [Polychytrium aggregatum]|uniref:uncharacterized protein n=1 Tax=Polychytrium aggregatum TaxID=110093 RepID=UPI0022FEC08A|nr:uncharacterized protein BJ171DRAFT_490637 [Polychytrium aggregatum]KAI9208205.1 hypothetical protein BJ171DRAFT_490637 [Polychytrium aggregatum]
MSSQPATQDAFSSTISSASLSLAASTSITSSGSSPSPWLQTSVSAANLMPMPTSSLQNTVTADPSQLSATLTSPSAFGIAAASRSPIPTDTRSPSWAAPLPPPPPFDSRIIVASLVVTGAMTLIVVAGLIYRSRKVAALSSKHFGYKVDSSPHPSITFPPTPPPGASGLTAKRFFGFPSPRSAPPLASTRLPISTPLFFDGEGSWNHVVTTSSFSASTPAPYWPSTDPSRPFSPTSQSVTGFNEHIQLGSVKSTISSVHSGSGSGSLSLLQPVKDLVKPVVNLANAATERLTKKSSHRRKNSDDPPQQQLTFVSGTMASGASSDEPVPDSDIIGYDVVIPGSRPSFDSSSGRPSLDSQPGSASDTVAYPPKSAVRPSLLSPQRFPDVQQHTSPVSRQFPERFPSPVTRHSSSVKSKPHSPLGTVPPTAASVSPLSPSRLDYPSTVSPVASSPLYRQPPDATGATVNVFDNFDDPIDDDDDTPPFSYSHESVFRFSMQSDHIDALESGLDMQPVAKPSPTSSSDATLADEHGHPQDPKSSMELSPFSDKYALHSATPPSISRVPTPSALAHHRLEELRKEATFYPPARPDLERGDDPGSLSRNWDTRSVFSEQTEPSLSRYL